MSSYVEENVNFLLTRKNVEYFCADKKIILSI